MRLRALALLILMMVCLSAGSGCVIGRHYDGRQIDPKVVDQIQIGVTTKQQVLDLLGPPRVFSRVQLSDLADRLVARVAGSSDNVSVTLDPTLFDEAYLYEYRRENETFFTVVLLYTYFMRDRKSDELLIIFDQRDVVSHVAYAEGTKELGNL